MAGRKKNSQGDQPQPQPQEDQPQLQPQVSGPIGEPQQLYPLYDVSPEMLEYMRQQKQEATRELFEIADDDDLIMKTETPDRMMLAMVMSEVVEEATNPGRVEPLACIFRRRLDRRMISRKRMGRKEVLVIHSTGTKGIDEEEELMV